MAPAGQGDANDNKAAATGGVTSVDPNTWYKLTNKFAGASALDIVNGDVGATVPSGGSGQSWQFLQQGDGSYRIRSQAGGPDKYLEAQGSSPHLAAKSDSGQTWNLVPLKNDGAFQIANTAGGLLLQSDQNNDLALSSGGTKPQTKWIVKSVGSISDQAFLAAGSAVNSSPANPSSPSSAPAAGAAAVAGNNSNSPSGTSQNSLSSPSVSSPTSSSPSNKGASESPTGTTDSPVLETGSASPSGTGIRTGTVPKPTATKAFASATVVIGPGYTSTIMPTASSGATSGGDNPNDDTPGNTASGHQNRTALAGAGIGLFIALLIAVICVFYWRYKKKEKRPRPTRDSVRLSDLPADPPADLPEKPLPSRTNTNFSVSDDGIAPPPPPFSPSEKPPLSPISMTPAAEAQARAMMDVEAHAANVEIGGGTRQTNYGLPDHASELSGSHARPVEIDSSPRYG